MSSKFRTSRSVRLAAAGGVLGVAAAVAGLGATGAQADTTHAAVEGSTPHTLVFTLDDGLAQSIRAAILEALAAAQQRSDDARAQGMKGGSPTGLEHSQRWHAAAAHAAHPPAFAGTDSGGQSDDPEVDGTSDQTGSSESSDDNTSEDNTSDGDHRHCDHDGDHQGDSGDGDHYGDRGDGGDHGDWGDHSDGDGGDQDGGHDDGGWGGGGHDD